MTQAAFAPTLLAWALSAFIALPAVAQPVPARLSPAGPTPAPATPELPDGFFLENAASGAAFTVPVEMAFAPDGRLFVAEKRGKVFVVEGGVKQEEPFVDLEAEVLSSGDRGLLGLALDPAFAENGHVYLSYVVDAERTDDTGRMDAFSRVTRYTASAADPNRAAPESRRVLLGQTFASGIPACFTAHVIGTLAFGSDGTLFVGSGDAASYDAPDGGGGYPECFGPGRFGPEEDIGAYRAQVPYSLAGKILRVDPETGLGLPSNPFWTGDGADNASRVWAMGLRNPFRFSVGPGGSTDPADGAPGPLYIGDVGFYYWEEVNVALGGENFGWPCFEGPAPHDRFALDFPDGPANAVGFPGCAAVEETAPPAYWSHYNAEGSAPAGLEGRSITGGDVYLGSAYPSAYHGRLFYADFSLGWMGTGVPVREAFAAHEVFSESTGPVVSVRYDAATESMHWIDVWQGAVFRLGYAGGDTNTPPVAVATAAQPTGDAFLTVAFDGSESFDPDGDSLSFFWDFGDGSSSTSAAPEHTYAEAGAYEALLLVTDDAGGTARYLVPVVVGSAPPSILWMLPSDQLTVTVGESVLLEAEAVDPEGAPVSYRWQVRQIHDIHEHPDAFAADGPEVLFDVPEHGIPGEYVGYRVLLTVSDPDGMSATDEFVLHAEYPHDLPPGWHTRVIGGLPRGGAARFEGGLQLIGGGLPASATRDYVRFAYQSMEGDGFLEARLDSLLGPGEAVAGLMVRDALLADAAHAFALWGPSGASFQSRGASGEARTVMPCAGAPASARWLRLERRGDRLGMLTSPDGESWTPCASTAITSAGTLFAGLAVSSRDSSAVAEARFSGVSGVSDFEPDPPTSRTLSIVRAFPNPTAGRLSLRLAWPTAEPARLTVVDVLGRRVGSFQATPSEAGEETVDVDLSGLPAGPYVVRVVQGSQSALAKVSVL